MSAAVETMLPTLPPGVSVEFQVAPSSVLSAEVHRVVAAVVALGGAVGWLDVPSLAETTEWLDRELALAAAGSGAVVAVRRHGRLEAVGVWSRFEHPVLRHDGEVRKVMVHPDARGHGLGRVVVTSLTEHARAAGVEVLVLDARGNNHGAHALYESLGWVEWGRIPNFIAVGDERWDRVCYYLDLGSPGGVARHGSNAVGAGASGRR